MGMFGNFLEKVLSNNEKKEPVADNFGHQTVPNRHGEELSINDLNNLPIEDEIKGIEDEIKKLNENQDQADPDRIVFLTSRLDILKGQL